MATRLYSTRIDLPTDAREALIGLLNQSLADISDLRGQTKQAHWNVKGSDFISLHKLFDELVESLDESVDTIAERVTALGGVATGTPRQVAKNSKVPELPDNSYDGMTMLTALADRFALVANSTRQAIETADENGDLATADLFTGVVRSLDKSLYFLESHLQK